MRTPKKKKRRKKRGKLEGTSKAAQQKYLRFKIYGLLLKGQSEWG